MFFSVDLLALKTSPYNRIWRLANENEKVKPGDMNLKTIQLAENLLEWIKKKTRERTSLPLSVDMAIGLSRAIHEQSKRLQRDCLKLKKDMKTPAPLLEKIPDVPPEMLEMFELDVVNTAPPELDFSNIAQANHDEITLREDHLLPSQNMIDMEDGFFGDEGQAGISTGFTMDIFDDGGPILERPMEEDRNVELDEPVIPQEDPNRMVEVEDQPEEEINFIGVQNIPSNVIEEPMEEEERTIMDEPVIPPEDPIRMDEDPIRMVADQPEDPNFIGVQTDHIPLVDEPPAPQMDLSSDIGPPRAKKAKKSKKLAIDKKPQLDQDKMRRLRQEKVEIDEKIKIPNPKALTADQLLKLPMHRQNCGQEIQKSLKRAYDDDHIDYEAQDGHQAVADEMVEGLEEERRGVDLLQLPDQSHAETTLSTIRDATRNMGHSRSRVSAVLESFNSGRDSGTNLSGALSEVGIPLDGIEPPDSQIRLEPIIENPALDLSEEVNPEEVPEPVQVPVASPDDTESSEMSSEPASHVMSTPTFGQFEFINKIPRNDTQDFRVVCDHMNLQNRREIAVAFSFLLEGLTDVPPKISAEQDEFMSSIDVQRK